jgi:hypothetical protein
MSMHQGNFEPDSKPPARAPLGMPERRADERDYLSVYRSATIRWREFEGLCLIRNIAPGGLMGKVHVEIGAGEQVTVEIRSGHPIAGHVIWSEDSLIGVQFAERIDVNDILQAPISQEAGLIQRMPRVRLSYPVTLQLGEERHGATLLDISQGGIKIEADFLRGNEDVVVAIRGLEKRHGVVRWSAGNQAGISFLSELPFDALAQWVLARQAEMAAAV